MPGLRLRVRRYSASLDQKSHCGRRSGLLAWPFLVLRPYLRVRYPDALIEGKPASRDDAIRFAAKLLCEADYPLVYGLGTVTCETQRAAVELAESLGAALDTHTSRTHGPNKIAAQLMGKVTCTLGEVRNRAVFVLYWGCNPVETHPRHLTRYSYTPKGRLIPNGRKDRKLVVVDVRPTATSRVADRFLPIPPGRDFEVLTVLRLCSRTIREREPACILWGSRRTLAQDSRQ